MSPISPTADPDAAAAGPPDWALTLGIVVGFLVFFPIIWCFVVWILSRASGWHRLVARYAAGSRPVTGSPHGGVTGMVGGVSYRSTLTLHFDNDGFFMEPMILFKIGQPRLFIPWTEITSRRSFAVFWWKATALSIGQPTVATISLPADLIEKHAPAV